jgi:uncharacterized metal-binding protein YceD (DUF177 family)
MREELAWKFPVVVADLPDAGREFELAPDAAERQSLARYADVNAVPKLVASLRVIPDGRGGASVDGTLRGAVTQNCVITLDEFDNPIDELISMRFAPAETIAREPDGLVDIKDDPPDPLVGGALDLAAAVAEIFSLAVDPYPRKPGAVFNPPQATPAGKDSPFAALEKLKGRASDEKG